LKGKRKEKKVDRSTVQTADKYYSRYPVDVFQRLSSIDKRQVWREAAQYKQRNKLGQMEVGRAIKQDTKRYTTDFKFMNKRDLGVLKYKISQIKGKGA